jgi:molybdopterin converting factor small subunit
MPISVQIPAPLREQTNGQATVSVAGSSVQGALDELGKLHPAIVARLFDNGQLRRHVNLFVNDEDVRYLDRLQTPLNDGDVLSIIPSVAGG